MGDITNPVVDEEDINVFEVITLQAAKDKVQAMLEQVKGESVEFKSISDILAMLDTVPSNKYQYYVSLANIELLRSKHISS